MRVLMINESENGERVLQNIEKKKIEKILIEKKIKLKLKFS